MPEIIKEIFGQINRRNVHLFRMRNRHGLTVELIEYGARIKSLLIPIGQNKYDNISVGFDNLAAYTHFNPWFGAVLGPTAGRVDQARFKLDGIEYRLEPNGPGGTSLHSGQSGFDKAIWTGKINESAQEIIFNYLAKDGEGGYPGNLSVTASYRLDDENRFHMSWTGICDQPTVLDMTSHVYFNLNGVNRQNVHNEFLQISSAVYMEKDANGTLTGNMLPVQDTCFDLRSPRRISEISQAEAFNPVFKLDDQAGRLRPVATVSLPENGRSYILYTTAQALQVYDGYTVPDYYEANGLASPFGRAPGLCLEPQNFPNAINLPALPSPILYPGQLYAEQHYFGFNW